jgi:sarcosine oxidase subunit beta
MFLLSRTEDEAKFKQNVKLQNSLGVNTQWLTGEEVRRLLPLMNLEDITAGTFNPMDGLADPNGVVMGYIKAAQRLGVKAVTGVKAQGIQVQNGQIRGLETSAGAVSTNTIVNAAGPWAGLIGQMAGVKIPITPIRRQMLTTTSISDLPSDFPFAIDFAQSLYFHPEGEGLLTGMSNPDQEPGFDQSIDPDWEIKHLEAATARLPLLEKAGLASRWAGLYEVTPDAHPVYGRTSVNGFFVCAGFSGHGFMHGPISGKLVAELILDGESLTVDVSELDLARFAEGRPIQEYNVV